MVVFEGMRIGGVKTSLFCSSVGETGEAFAKVERIATKSKANKFIAEFIF